MKNGTYGSHPVSLTRHMLELTGQRPPDEAILRHNFGAPHNAISHTQSWAQ
jgi:hypothetical protein